MAHPYAGEASALKKKAKWHEERAGSRLAASLERAGQLRYRAELMSVPAGHQPTGPDVKGTIVRQIAGRSVEPESRPGAGRPSPADFAWR